MTQFNSIPAEFRYDYHLFSEGGGDTGGLGAEASAFMDSISEGRGDNQKKQSGSKPDLSSVQYGRSSGEDQTRQVGSDNGPAEDLQAEFAALIGKGGRFHDIYGQKVSDAIQGRFKNQADLQGQVDQIIETMGPAFQVYGVEMGDLEGLAQAIAGDEDMYQRGAEREGLSLDQYKQNLELRAAAEKGRQITEAYERQMEQNRMFAQWEQEAAELQQAVPNFDLGMEIEHNETFAKLLDSGLDVRTAFAAAHMDDILTGNYEQATRAASQNVVNTIQSRASRPAEAGLRHAPAIQRKADPSALTNDDMDEILRRVEDGEKFSF